MKLKFIENAGIRIWLFWFDNLISFVKRRSRSPRSFVIISPPCISSQYLKEVKTGHTFRLKIRNRIDLRSLYDVFYKEQYKINAKQISSIYSTDAVIFDFGANIGCSVLYFLHMYPNARVVAVEPDADNFSVLKKNIFGYEDRITLLQGAVGNEDGVGSIVAPKGANIDSYDAFRVEFDKNGSVKIYGVDALFDSLRDLTIVKIDIEGFEKFIFNPEHHWYHLVHIFMIEGHDWMQPCNSTLSPFFRFISSKDYDVLVNGENIIALKHLIYDKPLCID